MSLSLYVPPEIWEMILQSREKDAKIEQQEVKIKQQDKYIAHVENMLMKSDHVQCYKCHRWFCEDSMEYYITECNCLYVCQDCGVQQCHECDRWFCREYGLKVHTSDEDEDMKLCLFCMEEYYDRGD